MGAWIGVAAVNGTAAARREARAGSGRGNLRNGVPTLSRGIVEGGSSSLLVQAVLFYARISCLPPLNYSSRNSVCFLYALGLGGGHHPGSRVWGLCVCPPERCPAGARGAADRRAGRRHGRSVPVRECCPRTAGTRSDRRRLHQRASSPRLSPSTWMQHYGIRRCIRCAQRAPADVLLCPWVLCCSRRQKPQLWGGGAPFSKNSDGTLTDKSGTKCVCLVHVRACASNPA